MILHNFHVPPAALIFYRGPCREALMASSTRTEAPREWDGFRHLLLSPALRKPWRSQNIFYRAATLFEHYIKIEVENFLNLGLDLRLTTFSIDILH